MNVDDCVEGMQVECVDAANGKLLTKGKIYEIIETHTGNGNDCIRVIADNGYEHGFYATRFKPAQSAMPSAAPIKSGIADPIDGNPGSYAAEVRENRMLEEAVRQARQGLRDFLHGTGTDSGGAA